MGRMALVVGACAVAVFGLQACGDDDSVQNTQASGGAAASGGRVGDSTAAGGRVGLGGNSATDGGAGGEACVPDTQENSIVCGSFTVGKGAACDLCVQTQCTSQNDECCHRGMGCSNPEYEYRIMLAGCIKDSCSVVCGVACENWPLPPL